MATALHGLRRVFPAVRCHPTLPGKKNFPGGILGAWRRGGGAARRQNRPRPYASRAIKRGPRAF